MKLLIPALLVVLLGTQASQAESPKIGTFHDRAVALAFYRSEFWSAELKSKVAERNREQKAGNHARVAELEAWGKAQQDLAHRQVFDGAPILNVLEHIRPSFSDIAKAAGVTAIVSDVHYVQNSQVRVDVTMHIVDWLKSSAQTRAMVRDVLGKGQTGAGAHKH